MESRLNRGIFIDRDGVMNVRRPDSENPHDWYVSSWDQFEWIPGVLEAFKILYSKMDYRAFVVSNQACVGKFRDVEPRFSYRNIMEIMKTMYKHIDKHVYDWIKDSNIDLPLPFLIESEEMPADNEAHVLRDLIMCPHKPDEGCCCRKPKPGMIYFLAFRWSIDLSRSWMIGDSLSDMKAGWNAGIRKLIHIVPNAKPFDPEKTGLVSLMARKQTRRKWNTASGFPLPDLWSAFVFINEFDATYRGRR